MQTEWMCFHVVCDEICVLLVIIHPTKAYGYLFTFFTNWLIDIYLKLLSVGAKDRVPQSKVWHIGHSYPISQPPDFPSLQTFFLAYGTAERKFMNCNRLINLQCFSKSFWCVIISYLKIPIQKYPNWISEVKR